MAIRFKNWLNINKKLALFLAGYWYVNTNNKKKCDLRIITILSRIYYKSF